MEIKKQKYTFSWYEAELNEEGKVAILRPRKKNFDTLYEAMKFYRENYNSDRVGWELRKEIDGVVSYHFLGC